MLAQLLTKFRSATRMGTNDAPFHSLASIDDLDAAWNRSQEEPVVFFKHSALCNLSARARRQIVEFAKGSDVPPVYEVVVQEARDVSNAIASRFEIRHESPQVIVVHRQQPLFDASHWHVKADAVREALAHVTAS